MSRSHVFRDEIEDEAQTRRRRDGVARSAWVRESAWTQYSWMAKHEPQTSDSLKSEERGRSSSHRDSTARTAGAARGSARYRGADEVEPVRGEPSSRCQGMSSSVAFRASAAESSRAGPGVDLEERGISSGDMALIPSARRTGLISWSPPFAVMCRTGCMRGSIGPKPNRYRGGRLYR